MSGGPDRTADVPAEGNLLGGRYALQELLGEGGTARVYRAHDRMLGRPVAVKVLRSTDPDDLARLHDEARAAAAIDHPGVVTVHDVGRTGDGVYLVMSVLHGETLEQRLERVGPLDPSEVVRIGVAVCDALGAAHRAGVVHRDVTPANIVLGPGDRVTVTDFGIARIGEGAGRTRTGYVIGTPQHMAPEQGRGSAHLDGRTDLYSLASCLFTALTGRPLFTDPDPFTVVIAHLRESPPRPSELRPGIPAALEEVLLRPLAKDPERRPRDAAELARGLTASTGMTVPVPRSGGTLEEPGPGTTAPAPGALERTIADVEDDDGAAADRRRGIGTLLVVLAALVVLAGVVVTVLLALG